MDLSISVLGSRYRFFDWFKFLAIMALMDYFMNHER